MTPERYQRMKAIFHSALEREPGERSAFLDAAVGGDATLRAAVGRLIAAHEREGSFLDAPAYEAAGAVTDDEPAAPVAGQLLGHYRVIELLGAGGMGDVYLARDERLGRRVALKMLPGYLNDDESRVRRLRQEARAASALNHPNIITVYEVDETGGRYFIATEYIEGETLRERLARGALAPAGAIETAAQVAAALAAAHQAGIVHRDVKPENIMVNGEGRVKLLDFGLAKFGHAFRRGDGGTQASHATLTTPGMVMGTTAYMSPEQARGLAVDERTDVWSLGVVLYEMLTGRQPFTGQTESDVLVAVLERDPDYSDSRFDDAPAELRRVVRKLLEKEPGRRYQTVKELVSELEGVRRRGDVSAERTRVAPLGPQGSRAKGGARNRAAFGLTAALLISAAGVFGVTVWRNASRDVAAPPPATAPAAPAVRQINYRLTAQKSRGGGAYQEPSTVGAETVFEKGDRVRLNFRSPQEGHLYILNEGPAPSGSAAPLTLLFPSPTANDGRSLLAAGVELQVPERSWFSFDGAGGTEKVWVVWSVSAVPSLEAVRGFANPRDRGVITDAELSGAAREFLREHRRERPRAEAAEGEKEVAVQTSGDILVHLLGLEHR